MIAGLSAFAQEADSTVQHKNKDMKWKELTDFEHYVIVEKGTERPFTGKYYDFKEKGVYVCKRCGAPLYRSSDKFDAHCGWPSFDAAAHEGVVEERTDNSLGMQRTEILCAKCGGHLGHVFPDGPTETGLRYCVNSLSVKLDLDKEKGEE